MTLTWSLAFHDIPRPDYAHATIVPLDAAASVDPAAWARRMFSRRYLPRWVKLAFGIRNVVSPLIGVPAAGSDIFAIREMHDDEVLVAADDRHLDFRCAIAIDEPFRVLRVTTTVRLHNARGRIYFLPVRLAHPIVIRAMIRAAARSWR